MLDWITVTIELVGLAILLLWIVIPICEFREILRIIRQRHRTEASRPREDGPRA